MKSPVPRDTLLSCRSGAFKSICLSFIGLLCWQMCEAILPVKRSLHRGWQGLNVRPHNFSWNLIFFPNGSFPRGPAEGKSPTDNTPGSFKAKSPKGRSTRSFPVGWAALQSPIRPQPGPCHSGWDSSASSNTSSILWVRHHSFHLWLKQGFGDLGIYACFQKQMVMWLYISRCDVFLGIS